MVQNKSTFYSLAGSLAVNMMITMGAGSFLISINKSLATQKTYKLEFVKKKPPPLIKKKKINKEENVNELTSDDNNLYEKLKELRLEIAKREKKPAYIIFPNTTLLDMAIKKPKNINEFIKVKGVGNFKSEKYGNEFINIILN